VVDQFHTFLLTVDYDLVEVRGAYLLGLDYQIILCLISEVYLHLIEVDLLASIRVHLCDMLRVQVLYPPNVHIRYVQHIPASVVLLLDTSSFVGVGSGIVHALELLLG